MGNWKKLLCWLLTVLFLCSLFLDFLLLGSLSYWISPLFFNCYFPYIFLLPGRFLLPSFLFLLLYFWYLRAPFFPQVCFLQKSSVLFLLHECNSVSYLFEDIHGILWGIFFSSCIACISYVTFFSCYFLWSVFHLSFLKCLVIFTCLLTLFNF